MKKGKRLVAVLAAGCVIAVSAAAIADGSSAKSTASKANAAAAQTPSGHGPPGGMIGGGPGGPGGGGGGGGIHSVSVVPDKAGTSFVTLTSDRGTVQSVDTGASTITIVEGTKSATYKTPTLTIPTDAAITLDAKKATLAEIKTGDRVAVSSSSEGTTVFATDSSFELPSGPGKAGPPGMGGLPPAGAEGTAAETKAGTASGSGTGSPTQSGE
jgi:hypothetical protein